MRVFITGASGWIGSAVTDELLAVGHEVVGLARSDAAAAALEAKGARVRRGDLDDLVSIRDGAADVDAVIHLANKHDFNNPMVSNSAERSAVEAIGEVLAGSHRTFVVASGVPVASAEIATERDASIFHGLESPRGGSENLALEYVDRGVTVVITRFAPTVHGSGDNGFISTLVAIARDKGIAGFPGDGSNRWPAVHRSDAARLVRLGLEKSISGSVLHAMGEEGVPTRSIAEAIGRGLDLPVEPIESDDVLTHFGWIGAFFGRDIPASSIETQKVFGWTPTGPTLLEDLESGVYFH